ncbi:hypothetical protein V8B97DRAFT_2025778 [Scleroderma yunnanense]
MSEIRLSLTEFLDAISWGGSDCTSNSQIHGACTSLMNSPRLPGILHHCITINDELETAAKLFKSPDDASNTFFMKISFCGLSDDLQATAPTLWSLLRQSAHMEKKYLQESNQGLSAKAFDTLHALTVMMSHKWAADHVQMSEAAMKELISYDNINIPFHVVSQHLHNKDNFSSGAAVTVYIKHHAETLKADSSHELQQCCAWGMKNPLTSLEIFHLGQLAVPHIQNQMTYEVLCFLLEAPEFNIKSYQYHDSSLLLPPEPVHALPHSKEHVTLQYMLGSVNIPGVSYADNKHLFWSGDLNTFDCLGWIDLFFGWLYLQMAYANSLYYQYLGTISGKGLMHTYTLLQRKGLATTATKGVFHHNLDELLCYMEVGEFSELWCKTLEELLVLAKRVVTEHALSISLAQMQGQPTGEHDEIREQMVMWLHDVLHYIVHNHAIKHGDVGLIEDFLPSLLYQFVGGYNSKYVIEILTILQELHKEWSTTVSKFVREHCWLVNFAGKWDSFLPIDMAQEHNIKDIRAFSLFMTYIQVTHRSEDLNIKWEYLKKLHPAIWHMEKEFNTLTQEETHTSPCYTIDVQSLESSYCDARLHESISGRKLWLSKNKAKDLVMQEAVKLHEKNAIQCWSENWAFEQSSEED